MADETVEMWKVVTGPNRRTVLMETSDENEAREFYVRNFPRPHDPDNPPEAFLVHPDGTSMESYNGVEWAEVEN